MKTELNFQEDKHNEFVKMLEKFTAVLPAAMEELKSQGVTEGNLTLEKIKGGEFTKYFENFHKTQQMKNPLTVNMIPEKYLDLYGYNSKKLEALENEYKNYLDAEYSFFEINNSFYTYAQNFIRSNPHLQTFVDNAPSKKTFGVFDFVKVQGNKIEINVPKEYFILYATNKTQLTTIQNVKDFVGIAKKLEMTSKDIIKPLIKYLDHKEPIFSIPGSVGLSEDLEVIKFDYHKILTIQ